MPWTPVHAALGDVSAVVDYALFERACAAGIAESASLDWKRALPLRDAPERGKQEQELELAKDIAAMANSGGGMIVYGVAEVGRGSSAADHLEPVGPLGEEVQRAIRRVAGTLIYPPVTALDLIPVTSSPDSDDGVLVMLVSDSSETPHLVHPTGGKRDWFVAPYRHGPDTAWMVERQIAAAYVAREARRRQREQAFDDRFDAFVSTLPGGDSTWVVAMAVPEVPSSRPRNLQQLKSHNIIERAWASTPLVVEGKFGPRDLTIEAPTRPGLRRFVRQGSRALAGSAVARARVELHGDGSVAAAFTRDGAIPGEGRQRGHVPLDDLEATARDLFALLWFSRGPLRITSDYTARIGVVPTTEVFRRPDSMIANSFLQWDEANRVHGYTPVTGPIIASEGLDGALRSWFDVANDALSQTGYNWPMDADAVLTELALE